MRLRTPLSVAIGIALILFGVGGRAAINHWMSTRIVQPVDMPVSLALGHIHSGPFRLNLDAAYIVILDPGTDWRWDSAHPECEPYRHLQTRWELSENGKVVDRLDQPTVLPWPSEFRAGPGVYELDVEVLSDFSCLDSIPPRLRVVAYTENYESAAFFARIGLSITTYVGFILVIFVPVIRFVHRFEHSETAAESAPIGQDFRWARKLSLRPPISGLPGFGLIGGVIFATAAIAMMMVVASAFVYRSEGLWVRLLKEEAVPQNSDAWTAPLVVLLKDAGPRQRPNLYLDSKQVAWEDFGQVLKQELGRRRDWVVYVGGDDVVAWQDVVTLIDAAHQNQARVFLITRTATPLH